MAKKAKKSARRGKKKTTRRKKASTSPAPVRAMSTHTLALRIRTDGSLTKPQPVTCRKGDLIVWQFTNDSAVDLEIAVGGLKFKKGGILIKKPLKFVYDSVPVPGGKMGEIQADIVHNTRNSKNADLLKYRITVEDPDSGDKDTYDPDLEVLPPPEVVPGGGRNPKGPRGGN